MRENHRRAVEGVVAELEGNPSFRALILAGSVARGTALPASDIDLLLVATDEEYAQRLSVGDLSYVNQEVCNYEGGYADGKIVPLSFIEEVVERGSEPARAAFVGVRILHSRIPELAGLLERATAYPESERVSKIESFYAQLLIHYWYIDEALKRDDRYLLTRSVSSFTLFAGRLILAYNRILFPYHRWFMHELRGAAEKPDDLIERMECLLQRPCKEHANALLASVANFRDWEKPPCSPAVRFMQDSEWSWRSGLAPIEDR